MIIKKRFIKTFIAIGAALMLMIFFMASYMTAFASASKIKNLVAGSTWVINENTSLTRLNIAEGASIKAPEGYSVTLTVDGVETAINPGSYDGNIVLTVTKGIIIDYSSHGTTSTYHLRTAIDIENGKYIPKKSVAAAVVGGKVTDTSAKDIKITSVGENFNGIIVRGDSKSSYAIINPVINLSGNGGNDFVGYGVAIMSEGNAEVTVSNASIINHGVIRAAVVVKGNSRMHVNDSYIEVHNGILPETIVGMMQVPWVLGLTGNVRATNLIENGTVYYNNTHIKAQAWGALSTDATDVARLYATNCLIETLESGYGAYSIGDCIDTFSNCTLNVADYGLIMGSQGDGVFTDGTVVNSGRFGVMMHSGSGGTLTIDKGSVFNTKSTVIQVKGRGANIEVDNARLNSESGVILQAMVNDDPHAMGGGMPGARFMDNYDVTATFKNVDLDGDIINSMTNLGDMIVTFRNANITGAITTAIAKTVAATPTKENYKLIGEVVNTYCATDDKYGIKVFLDKDSNWVVDNTSYLSELTIAESSAVKAPKGHSITMTVDGIETEIQYGSYKGKIVITVSKIS